RLHVFRKLRGIDRGFGHLLDGDGLIGLGARKNSVGKIHGRDIDLQIVRGDRLGLNDDFVRGEMKRGAGHGCRTPAAGAFAKENLIRFALYVFDVVRVQPETVGDNLLERRLVTPPLVDAAGEHRSSARTIKTDFGAFKACSSRTLDTVGNSNAAQLAAFVRV